MFEIVIGTYEEFLLGYNLNAKESIKSSQTFALHSHASSVRSVSCSEKLLASGGADDRIIIYDLKARRELCMLTHHNATVNCLTFTKDHSHLISGSQDGVLSIIRVGNWQMEKVWDKAHKGSAIIDMAVHPTGKLLLTLGADCTLRTWNLVKGRQAYAVNLNSKSKDPKNLQQIRWSPDGTNFTLIGGKYTEIWSIESGGIIKAVEHETRVTCCEWIDEENLIAGYEDGKVAKFNTKGEIKNIYEGHKTRVKVLAVHGKHLVTGASDGIVNIWILSNMKHIHKIDTGCRLTCIAIAEPFKVKKEESEENNIEAKEKTKIGKKRTSAVVIEIEEEDDDVQQTANTTPSIEGKKKRRKRKAK